MFFRRVKLSRNGFHWKVQKFVLGKFARYDATFCSYWWKEIFCIIVLPVVAPVKLLITIIVFLGGRVLLPILEGVGMFLEALLNVIDKWVCRPTDNYFVTHMPNETVYNSWKSSKDHLKGRYVEDTHGRGNDKFQKWKKTHPRVWKKELEGIVKVVERQRKEAEDRYLAELPIREAREKKMAARQKKLEKFIIITAKVIITPIVAIVITAVVLAVVAFIAWLLWRAYVVLGWHWDAVVQFITNALYMTGMGIMMAIPTGVVLFLLVKLVMKCQLTIPMGWLKPVGRFFGWIFGKLEVIVMPCFRALGTIGYAISSGFSFFGEFLWAVKENHCPMIEWHDE